MSAAILVGVASIGASVGLFVYLLLARPAPATEPAEWAEAAVTPPPHPGLAVAEDPDDLPPLYRRVGRLAAKFTPSDYEARLRRKLDLAGNPRNWGPERVLAFKGFGLILGLALGLLIGTKQGGALVVLLPVVLAAFGLFLPDLLVRNLGEHRQADIVKGLPDVMDMLTVCVEAGLGFDAALGRVARNLTGPMPQECARMLQEMQFGKSRAEALRALADRTDVPELRSFASAMVQASELGISVANVLREQAHEMRIRRRQRAEEKAQKLQVKILAPLVLCLLPCIFIVVLGPAAMQLMHFFHNAPR